MVGHPVALDVVEVAEGPQPGLVQIGVRLVVVRTGHRAPSVGSFEGPRADGDVVAQPVVHFVPVFDVVVRPTHVVHDVVFHGGQVRAVDDDTALMPVLHRIAPQETQRTFLHDVKVHAVPFVCVCVLCQISYTGTPAPRHHDTKTRHKDTTQRHDTEDAETTVHTKKDQRQEGRETKEEEKVKGQGTGDRGQGTGDKRSKTKDQRPKTKDQRPKTKGERRKAKGERRKAKGQRPKTNDKRPKTKDQRPKAKDQRPKTKDQ
jgi:hypothetical protein